MPAKRIWIILGLGLVAFAAIAGIDVARPVAWIRLCNLYRDAITRAGRTTTTNSNLVFLAIDAASVSLNETDTDQLYNLSQDNSEETRALRLISKGFPWSREIYGLVLKRLAGAGARVVIFDLNFPTSTSDDALFRDALNRYSDYAIIGSNFVDGTLTRPCETLIPLSSPTDDRIGFTNFWADDDEVVRRAQYRVTFDQIRGTINNHVSERFVSLAGGALIKAGFAGDVPDDLDARTLRFTAPPRRGFPPHSLFEIFVPAFWRQNYQSGEFFRDKIVIVGAEGNWQHDEHLTPFGSMPGAELHLNAINAAIHHEFVRELRPSINFACIALAGLLAIAATLLLPSPWVRLAVFIGFGLGIVAGSLFCFNRASFYLPVIAPFTQFSTIMLFGLICDFTSERIEKNRVRRVLERYVSRDVVHEIVDLSSSYKGSLGGVTKPVAILFSDIRAYSAVTAQSSPETLVAQLNEYFTAMVECVFQYGGTIDKFIGDAVMAIWGSLHSRGPCEDALAAVEAALSMQEKIICLNRSWHRRGWPELRVGMAINYGEVVVGNIGSPQRMEFTVIGDAVNVSWKLQELTKIRRAGLIVSESVAKLVAEHFDLQSLGTTTLDNSHKPCEIYTLARPIGAEPIEAKPLVNQVAFYHDPSLPLKPLPSEKSFAKPSEQAYILGPTHEGTACRKPPRSHR
jgi:adenylate cyclase